METSPSSSNIDKRKIRAAIQKHAKSRSGKTSNLQYTLWIGGALGAIIFAVLAVFLTPTKKPSQVMINDDGLISHINYKSNTFTAAPSSFFDGWTQANAARFGTFPPKESLYRASTCNDAGTAIAPMFDSRKKWPDCFSKSQIYNSGNCTSAWATMGATMLSERYCISDESNFGKLKLSPQSLMSCNRSNKGCKGGSLENMFTYMQSIGINTEKCFPYQPEARGVPCDDKCKDEKPLKIDAYCMAQDTEGMQREIQENGPIIAHVMLHDDFLVYSEGIYAPISSAKKLNTNTRSMVLHPVKVIGWGKKGDISYWLIENTWGTAWGEDGYAKLLMGPEKDGGIIFNNMGFAAVLPLPEDPEREARKAKRREALNKKRTATEDDEFEADEPAVEQQAEELALDDDEAAPPTAEKVEAVAEESAESGESA